MRALSAAGARRYERRAVTQDRTPGAQARPAAHRRDPRRRWLWAGQRAHEVQRRPRSQIGQVHSRLSTAPLRKMMQALATGPDRGKLLGPTRTRYGTWPPKPRLTPA